MMGCKACDETNDGKSGIFYYRWKNANIGVMGCREHVTEVFKVLSEAQKEKDGE